MSDNSKKRERERARRADPAYREWQRTYHLAWHAKRMGDPAYVERRRQYGVSFRKANPDYGERERAKKYGISVARLRELLSRGRCAICGTDTPGGRYNGWHIDHDKVTGVVRDTLCSKCNQGIGLLQEDPDLLRAAADYVEKHNLRDVLV